MPTDNYPLPHVPKPYNDFLIQIPLNKNLQTPVRAAFLYKKYATLHQPPEFGNQSEAAIMTTRRRY
jgi:hypothetical protein